MAFLRAVFCLLALSVATLAAPSADPSADVLEVSVRETSAGKYMIGVTLETSDVDCTHYANWWEVLSEDGELLYRRILRHSHAATQPFTRYSEDDVSLEEDQEIIVRAHMHVDGKELYPDSQVLKGSAKAGFAKATLEKNFAAAVEKEGPQAEGCLY
ncbi:unnamed protein product [Vitrella brassicaformis CCMP3155]|uniref:Uncharacterized protein n=1 Tax=Vitrella brassicaformis (strain CCMP3155) TaxID=1169540 RepID=A0A0G4GQJ2_VITBC|nr:unnamed protein product [Vitrella brassicaformis CCMP3155]|eukprot:CEM32708.1 unnamed protein product [Vitrella brassicaformis CCMP3155]